MATHLFFHPLSLKSPTLSVPFSATASASTTIMLNVRTRRTRPARPVVAGSTKSYKVTIEHEGKSTTLEVGEDETILEKALDEGMDVPHDCKLGVCMTCPARLVEGKVDQSEGMLSDDVVDRGYTLLCASYPRSDCHIHTIPEEELLSLQLATSSD